MKYLDGIGAQFADGFGPARALSALWIALGCALLVPIGARLYRFRAGVLAAAIAALLPPLVAHGQIVGHESPTVLWWSLGDPARARRARRLTSAPAAHAALGSRGRRRRSASRSRRASSTASLGPLCLAIVVDRSAPPRGAGATLAWAPLIMPLVALATLYAVWPRLWLHPIAALRGVVREARAACTRPSRSSARSRTTPARTTSSSYLLATLPLGVLAGVLAGVVRARRDARSRAR